MWDLIFYLYRKHVNYNDKHAGQLCKQQPIKVYTLSQQQLAFYSTMLIRNFFSYSISNMQIKLSTKHLLGMYRLHKFQEIMKKAGVQRLYKEWIQNQMMPLTIKNSKSIPNNCPYIYIDFKQEKQQDNKNEVQQVQLKRNKSKPKQKGNKQKQSQKQKKQTSSEIKMMINVLQLTKQLQNRILIRQNLIKPQQILKQDKRSQAIQKFRIMKIQQFIYEKFNKQTLMTYNFIKRFPFIEQKQLLNKTMLPVIQLRKSLSNLIQQGFINFYPESSKSMLYRTLNEQRAQERYRDHISQTILNLHHYLNKPDQKDQQKMAIILKSLDHLDDILMMFMA